MSSYSHAKIRFVSGLVNFKIIPTNRTLLYQNSITLEHRKQIFFSSNYATGLLYNLIQQPISSGYPFVVGFTVYDSFESNEVAKTGILPLPSPGEKVLGGHCVLVVGYDDAQNTFISFLPSFLGNRMGYEWLFYHALCISSRWKFIR